MKKTKAVLSISFLVTIAIAIGMFFAFFINVLENISIGKAFNYPYFISFVVAVVASIVINVRLKRIAIKEECSEREKAAQEYWDKFRERRGNVSTTMPCEFESGGVTSSEECKGGGEKIKGIGDQAINKIKKSTIPKKRSHQSRKSTFDLQKAINQGMAMYIDGKRHVNVSIRKFDRINVCEIRGISNGVYYGKLSATGSIFRHGEKVKGYLINI